MPGQTPGSEPRHRPMPTQSVTTTIDVMPARSEQHHAARALTIATVVFSLLAGYGIWQYTHTQRFPLHPVDLSGCWVQAPGAEGYAGHFRYEFDLDSTATNAWLSIAACDGFEITVNRDPVARHYVWRPTRPFQNGLSEKGQRVSTPNSLVDLNFPREYQWSGHDSYRIPVLVDIRPELKRGRNVISVQIESRRAPARFALIGHITLANGRTVPLKSGKDWRAAAVPPRLGVLDWTDPDYHDAPWGEAVPAAAPPAQTWRSFDVRPFTTLFHADLLQAPQASATDSVWFRSRYHVPAKPRSAWIRLLSTRPYDLFVNDQRVSYVGAFPPDADAGQWLMGRSPAQDPQERPAILDPDELDSPFVGRAFEQPTTGDPTRTDFRALPLVSRELRLRGCNSRTLFSEKFSSVWNRELDPSGPSNELHYPYGKTPAAHHKNRLTENYVAYDLSRVVRPGQNVIEVRLAELDSSSPPNWPGRLAIDGTIDTITGVEVPLRSDDTWQARVTAASHWQRADSRPLSDQRVAALPRLQFRGVAENPTTTTVECIRDQFGTWVWITVVLFILLTVVRIVVPAHDRPHAVTQVRRLLFGVLVSASSVLSLGLLVWSGFAERHETLWFQQPRSWAFLLLSAMWFGIFAALADLGARRDQVLLPRDARFRGLRQLPSSHAWRFAICLILLVSFGVRAYRLDFQPLDDDEYASTQAILNVAATGVPTMASEDVWYTRSPLFHYALGACAAVWGPNLWTLRLPNVLCGVATCWLTYLIGSRLLKRPWVGMGAMLIMAIHPFEVYTSHVVRFYQMQQMMALLTIYCFCRGFVTEQAERFRLATVLAFLGTVLCQEASCVMGFSLLLCYVMFASSTSVRSSLRLLVAAACALVIIGLDYVAFETRCMTRPAGISPNLEAAIEPHLWYPYNLLALFIGYSRLHLVPSCFLLCGLPLCCRRRDRCTLALAVILFSGVLFTNVMVTHISLRYQYWLIPLWALLCLEGMRASLTRLAGWAFHPVHEAGRHRRLLQSTAAVSFLSCLFVMSPWRIWDSYDVKLVGDSTGALQYVRTNLRPGDAVMVTEPHTHAALLEVGKVDYDLSVPLLYDFAMDQDGELVDRNAGAIVIGDIPHLADVLRSHQRVWITVNHEKLRSRGKNLRWEYPGARVELYLRQNCELVHKTYLWSVYLWDAQTGVFAPFRSQQL